MTNNIQILRGMRDLEKENSAKLEYFLKIATKNAKNMGFNLISTPILEMSDLFKRGVGSSSDIVNKEMYNFIDKGENDVSLRPEGTAGVVRSYLESKYDKQKQKKKYHYYGPMFRYERPQKGRFRQFNQFGCESFGHFDMYEDANLIILCANIFNDLDISYTLEINSLGCEECMPKYKQDLKKEFDLKKDDFCKDCHYRIDTNPMRIFDCKNQKCNDTSSSFSYISDNLCECCNNDFEKLQSILISNKIKFQINKNLVRGLDYYSKSAFEFVSYDVGSQSAIAGGGRYDKLIKIFGGENVGAVGFAIGIDRILELIELKDERDGIYFGCLDEKDLDLLHNIAIKQAKHQKISIEYKAKKLIKHLKLADKENSKYCAILGEDEIKNNSIWIKDLITKKDKTIPLSEFNTTIIESI